MSVQFKQVLSQVRAGRAARAGVGAGAAAVAGVRVAAPRPGVRLASRRPRAGRPPGGGPVGGPPGGSGGPPAGGWGGFRTPGGPGGRPGLRGRARGAPPPQPVALAVAVRAADFAGLARHGLFGAVAFREYLRQTESRLRALRAEGLEVHLRVLDPPDFEDYCAAYGFDPSGAAGRVAYAADPELAGEPFVYAGERLTDLLPVLLDDHRARVRITVAGGALLEAVGEGPLGQPRLVAVMTHVAAVWLALTDGAGEGRHLLTLRCHGPEDGEELTAAADVRVTGGRLIGAGRDVEAFCVTLAAGAAAGGEGALLLHGDPAAPGGQVIRGWALAGGRLRPMTAQEVFDALADDVGRGLPHPPGAVPLPGFALPDPPPVRPPRSGRGPAPGSSDHAPPGADSPDREGGGPLA